MKPFLITGMGCSGTKFLADTLNLSPTWTVCHEQPNDHQFLEPNKLSWAEFDVRLRKFVNHYGEVNSQLRRTVLSLKTRQTVRIFALVRHPAEILQSVHDGRGRDRSEFNQSVIEISSGLKDAVMVMSLAETVIRFEEMVTGIGYLKDLAKILGITDIPWEQVDLKRKVNGHSHGSLGPIQDWSEREREYFRAKLGTICNVLGYPC